MATNHFTIANIPFGIASSASHPEKSVATRLENNVIFLDELVNAEILQLPREITKTFAQVTLNAFAALPKAAQIETRTAIQQLLAEPTIKLPISCVIPQADVTMHLPVQVGDFTDFSCSKDHVLNAGEAIQKKRQLPPSFLHCPVGYTGRTSSLVVSGSSIIRPKGSFFDGDAVIYGPTRSMDYELEVACIIGKPSTRGHVVHLEDAEDHIFGLVLLNDWSARDIQGLEMVPLGPMNGKSFGTSISPWVVTWEALKPSEIQAPPREHEVVSYLTGSRDRKIFDITLSAELITTESSSTICETNIKTLYWNFPELVTQQTINGCNINTGDLLATGTISGNTNRSHGCLLEASKGGQTQIELQDGSKRTYLKDGDTIKISGWTENGVGFGNCIGKVEPSKV